MLWLARFGSCSIRYQTVHSEQIPPSRVSVGAQVGLHGAPGSQNGLQESGHEGDMHWTEQSNQDLTVEVLERLTRRYAGAGPPHSTLVT